MRKTPAEVDEVYEEHLEQDLDESRNLDEKRRKGSVFEEKIKRLEEIVGLLEAGGISLEDSLSLYEEGKKLARECRRVLEEAEMKIEHLEEMSSHSSE